MRVEVFVERVERRIVGRDLGRDRLAQGCLRRRKERQGEQGERGQRGEGREFHFGSNLAMSPSSIASASSLRRWPGGRGRAGVAAACCFAKSASPCALVA